MSNLRQGTSYPCRSWQRLKILRSHPVLSSETARSTRWGCRCGSSHPLSRFGYARQDESPSGPVHSFTSRRSWPIWGRSREVHFVLRWWFRLIHSLSSREEISFAVGLKWWRSLNIHRRTMSAEGGPDRSDHSHLTSDNV